MKLTLGKHKLNPIPKAVAYTTLVGATDQHRESAQLYSRC